MFQISDAQISNSADTSFEHAIMKMTGGKGVDVVLNTLREDKLAASVNCLARYGRFIQIKKTDLRNGNLNGNLTLVKMSILHEDIVL